jgi:hypothetical protein
MVLLAFPRIGSVVCLAGLFLLNSCSFIDTKGQNAFETSVSDSLNTQLQEVKKTNLETISQDKIREYASRNACYLPMLIDSSLYEPGRQVGFTFEELFNERLTKTHPYGNRYLVGDFNVLDVDYNNKGVEEINPHLSLMRDFDGASDSLLRLMDEAVISDTLRPRLESLIRQELPEQADLLMNFFDKVWKYKTPPLFREFGVEGAMVYAAGQHIHMCEAYQDTLVMVGRFAVSGRRYTYTIHKTPEGKSRRIIYQSLPIDQQRNYYAGRYQITSKNWETERLYQALDIKQDSLLGGGNNRVTFFQGQVQLPNFLLMHPVSSYPYAMPSNGIHEVALSELSRGMLGSPNSIGCIRMTDFGSKFLRWWTPQDSNFFILYSNDRYQKKIEGIDVASLYPFKTKAEGDRFRKWLNQTMPETARRLEIDLIGDHKNGYIIDAYTTFKKEYDAYLKANLLAN